MFARFFRRRPSLSAESQLLDLDLSPLWEGDDAVAREDPGPPVVADEFDESEWCMEIARRAMEQVEVEEIRRGVPYAYEQRMKLATELGKQLVDASLRDQQLAESAGDTNAQLLQLLAGLGRVSDLLQEQIDGQPANRARRVWREHPFLSGYLGAAAWHEMKRTRR